LLATLLWAVPAPQAALAQGAGASSLPALGDEAGDELSVPAEARLGERIMQQLRRDPDVVDDPLLVEYIERIWAPLLTAAKARGDVTEDLAQHLAWQTFVVRDRTINAFALPGGYVGVHLGLIALTSSRDELAAVLAHEMSHITQRHIARSVATSRRQSMLGVATLIVGILAASRSADAANAMIAGGQAVAVQGQLNFSRDMEREADRIGFGVLDAAGFAPSGMAMMFDRLQGASRLNDGGQFPYLRSHPLTSERIAEARSRLGVASGAAGVSAPEPARWLHAAMQGRARALMDSRSETLMRLAGGGIPGAAAAANTPEALSSACAAALAATRLKDWRVADAALARARALAAPQGAAVQRAVQVLQVESLLERGQPAQAASVLSGGGLLDGTRAGLLLAARLATQPQSDATLAARAREDLQTWVAIHPGDAGAWQAWAQLAERLGQPLASLRAQAEARAALGDLPGAIDRLRAGQRLARGSGAVESMEGIVIESRLKALEQQRRAEMERERRGEDD